MDILRWFTRKFGSGADNIHLLLAEEGGKRWYKIR